MLIVAYKTNDKLVTNYQNDTTNCSAIILGLVTLTTTVVNAWWIVEQYMSFRCGYNEIMMTITLIAVVLMHGLVLLRSRKDASILTSSIASMYCLYLQWTAMSSDQDGTCNDNLGESSNTVY